MGAVLASGGREDDKVMCTAGGTATAAATGVVPLLDRCWPTVLNVATKALGLSVDPDTVAIELAHIRSGCAPGSFKVTRRERG